MSKDKISFNDAQKIFKAFKPAVVGNYFAVSVSSKLSSCANYDELSKLVKLLMEQVAQLLAIFSKSIPSHNDTSKSNLTPLPVVIPSTSTSDLCSQTKSQVPLAVTKILKNETKTVG